VLRFGGPEAGGGGLTCNQCCLFGQTFDLHCEVLTCIGTSSSSSSSPRILTSAGTMSPNFTTRMSPGDRCSGVGGDDKRLAAQAATGTGQLPGTYQWCSTPSRALSAPPGTMSTASIVLGVPPRMTWAKLIDRGEHGCLDQRSRHDARYRTGAAANHQPPPKPTTRQPFRAAAEYAPPADQSQAPHLAFRSQCPC